MAKSPPRKSGKKTVKKTVGKMVPGRNGGMIWSGAPANPGAGTGRPPDALRAAMREKLEIALPDLWAKYQAGKIDALDFANFLAKYGLATKELVIASNNAAAFFDCVSAAAVELFGQADAERLKARAVALMEASK